tara:strand:- start:2072 stop:2218 length:147 start_codon:yes stop_codon:yes gene_type:complete
MMPFLKGFLTPAMIGGLVIIVKGITTCQPKWVFFNGYPKKRIFCNFWE